MNVRRMLGGAAALVLAATLAACSGGGETLADEYRAGDDKGYIAGSYDVVEIPAAERGAPVEFAGVTEHGDKVSNDDSAGGVLVVNFWYAGCPPCRVEAPDLAELSELYEGEGATFLGVNTRDQAPQSLTFAEEFGIGYPSVIDAGTGNMLLAFAGTVGANAVPTTLVIDKQGRVAARFLGLVEAPSTLKTLIREAIAEDD